MEINLKEIINIQDSLDKYIEDNHNLISKDLISRKRLALIIELSELCNEIRCFKYWSLKEPSSKEIILNEFVDCLHFILSICIFYKVTEWEFIIEDKNTKMNNIELSELFVSLISAVELINNKENATKFLKKLFVLASELNFSFKEINEFYLTKNQINIDRQKNKY